MRGEGEREIFNAVSSFKASASSAKVVRELNS